MTSRFCSAGVKGQPALVFLHGVGGDGSSFNAQLAHFSASHFCLAWHMPGYADTPMVDPYDWPHLTAALIDCLDQAGLSTATLVGHSIGGMVAQHAVAAAPKRIEALVLSATSPAFGSRDGSFQQAFLEARLGPLDRGSTLAELAPGIVDSLLGEDPDCDARDQAIACMAKVPELSYRAAMAAITTFDARDLLDQIACPTLLISGEHDGNAPPAMMSRMASKIPDATYQCLSHAGHLAYMEQPDAFNQCVSNFLRTHHVGRTP